MLRCDHSPVQRPLGDEYPLRQVAFGMVSISKDGPLGEMRLTGAVESVAVQAATAEHTKASSSRRARLVVIVDSQ